MAPGCRRTDLVGPTSSKLVNQPCNEPGYDPAQQCGFKEDADVTHLCRSHQDTVGLGTGALTQYLWPRHPRLELVEVDGEAVAVLNERFEGVVIHQQDILKVYLPELIPSQLDVKGADSEREVDDA